MYCPLCLVLISKSYLADTLNMVNKANIIPANHQNVNIASVSMFSLSTTVPQPQRAVSMAVNLL